MLQKMWTIVYSHWKEKQSNRIFQGQWRIGFKSIFGHCLLCYCLLCLYHRSGESQSQEMFLAHSADKQIRGCDTECSNPHPFRSALGQKGRSKMKWWAMYTNLKKNAIVRQPHSRSSDGYIYVYPSLREKCPNTESFLARIFLYSDWIRRDTEYLSIFSSNSGKYGAGMTPCLDTFHAEHLSICLSTYLPTYLSIYLSIYLSLYLPIYLS